MHGLRQVLAGLGVALVSILITLGGLAISLAEGGAIVPTSTLVASETPTLPPLLPTLSPTPTSLPPTSTTTQTPSPTPCPVPEDWVGYIVQPGDTLEGLAELNQVSVEILGQANCLVDSTLQEGSLIYFPPLPTQTPLPGRTAVPCGPPRGWVRYTVQPHDTLYRLSQLYGITVRQLQVANCMGDSVTIVVGRILYVPYWATRTPSPTFYIPPFETDTPWPTDTSTPELPPPTEEPPPTEPPPPVP